MAPRAPLLLASTQCYLIEFLKEPRNHCIWDIKNKEFSNKHIKAKATKRLMALLAKDPIGKLWTAKIALANIAKWRSAVRVEQDKVSNKCR